VSAEKLATVVVSVVRHAVHDLLVEIASSEEIVLFARRGNVLREESERHRVARELHEHHERKGIVLYASRENGPLDPGELKALLRELQSFKRPRKSPRSRYLQFRIFKRSRYLKLRQHRHLHRAMALLKVSRGDSKPCYWHRHDISIASNIAVA